MARVHKKKTPTPLRPVVSQCGSQLGVASTYLDHKLQPLTLIIYSYIKDSNNLIYLVKLLGKLTPGARLFTCDAISMHTSIDPVEGIQTIEKFLCYFTCNYFSKQKKDLIIKLLTLIMNSCIFKFADKWWLQDTGTAMGTLVACIYAILFFGYYEQTIILCKYKRNLLFYKRQIDDVIGIWVIIKSLSMERVPSRHGQCM